MKTPHKLISTISLSFLLSLGLAPILAPAQENKTVLPAIGTSAILGKVNGVAVEAKVQSPSNEATPLQIVCVFEYTEGDQFNTPNALPPAVNGMVHVDQQLKGLVTELRKSGKFEGHALETILITPPAGSISAKRLLIIGLGDRNKFSPELMISVGRTGMREALRLGVASYAHASDLKDGGLDSPTAIVASNTLKGAFEAYRTELELKSRKLTSFLPLSKITLLAGPAFYTVSGEAIKSTISQLNQ
jgi:hypothetical protein